LYTLTVKNRFGLKDQILDKHSNIEITENVSCNLNASNSSNANITSSTLDENNDDINSIKITFGKTELDNLLVTKQYTRSEKR